MARRSLPTLVAALLAVALAVSCGGDGEKKETKGAVTTTTEPAPTAPLTGLPDTSGQSLTRPALWVKIENTPDARPQAGLDVADVVYEEVVEGQITRFLAVFNSTVPDTVGPIRSVRKTDPNVVVPLGGVFAYSGGAQPNVEVLQQTSLNLVDETAAGDAMFRDPNRPAPHDLFGNTQALFDKGGDPKPPPPLFTYYGEDDPTAGDPVQSVRIGFATGYDPTYTYDAGSRSWRRSYGLDAFVGPSGDQVAPANVVVQFTDYQGGVGNPAAEGVTVGEGDVWVFTDGKVVRGRWVRPDPSKPAQYVDAAGEPIKLLPGRTWVHLLPIGAAVETTAPPPPDTTATTAAPEE